MANILLVEDMSGIRDSLEMILEMAGHKVASQKDGESGIKALSEGNYDILITDILMPGVDGTEVIMQCKQTKPNIKILAISAGGKGVSADAALQIASQKADATMQKPFSKEELLDKINELLV